MGIDRESGTGRRERALRRVRSLIVASLVVAGCGDGSTSGPAGTPQPPPALPPAPSALIAAAGDAQSAAPGERLSAEPSVRVLDDDGLGVAGIAVRFDVLTGGGSVERPVATTDAEGMASSGAWTLGPEAGTQTLRAAAEKLPSVTFTATAALEAASIEPTAGDGQSASVGAQVATSPEVRVLDAGGRPVPGVPVAFFVAGGGGSLTGASSTTDADGRARAGSWTVGPSPGPNSLAAVADVSGLEGNPVIFTATGVAPSPPQGSGGGAYDIEVRYNVGSAPTGSRLVAFQQAESRWERVIAGDLPDVPIDVAAGTCTSDAPIQETIDDLVIFVTLEPIDGAGGVLGTAGPCLVRSGSRLPLAGQMRFDVDDLDAIEAAGALDAVIAHEMGHVLGIGTLWSAMGLLHDPSLSGGTDPHFDGSGAIAAFDANGGSGYPDAKVPVENSGGSGTADGHWRESVFGRELMTGWISVGPNPLSAITTRSLADQGYVVDASAADGYGLPGSYLVVPAPGSPRVWMAGDVRKGPIELISPTGARLGLLPR